MPRAYVYKAGMDKNRIIMIVVAVVAALGLAAHFRYEITPAGTTGGIYKTDRWTGSTVHIAGGTLRNPKPPSDNLFSDLIPPSKH